MKLNKVVAIPALALAAGLGLAACGTTYTPAPVVTVTPAAAPAAPAPAVTTPAASPLVGVWYGSGVPNGWSGTLTITPDSFAFSAGGDGCCYTGTWVAESSDTLLINGNSHSEVWTYTINGNTLTYASSDGTSAVLTKLGTS